MHVERVVVVVQAMLRELASPYKVDGNLRHLSLTLLTSALPPYN